MKIYFTLVFAVYGLLFGSFYNVVAFRLSQNLSIFNPRRSFCPKCNHLLGVRDLIPVISYIFLRGKCRYCNSNIPVFYPIIEMLTALGFGLSFFGFSWSFKLFISIILISLLAIILVSDTIYYIIPDEIIISSIILMIIPHFYQKDLIKTYIFASIVVGVVYIITTILSKIFKKEVLGGGDIKLLFIISLIIGAKNIMLMMFIASLLALPVSLYSTIKKHVNIIPFGPYLMISTMLIYYLQLDTIKIIKYLYFL